MPLFRLAMYSSLALNAVGLVRMSYGQAGGSGPAPIGPPEKGLVEKVIAMEKTVAALQSETAEMEGRLRLLEAAAPQVQLRAAKEQQVTFAYTRGSGRDNKVDDNYVTVKFDVDPAIDVGQFYHRDSGKLIVP